MCRVFDACMLNSGQARSAQDLDKVREEGFADWLHKVLSDHDCDPYIRRAGLMPQKQAECYQGYEVNGFRFHTEAYGENKSAKSSGVCIKGEWDGIDTPQDYYGLLQEVIELDYDGLNKVVLFRCNWFDITNGVRVDIQHGIVEVKHASRIKNYEPFVLAPQAIQVFYLTYASDKIERRQWWVAMKTSAKGRFRAEDEVDANLEFFQDEMPDHPIEVSNGLEFDWDGMPQEDEFELVDDTMSQDEEECDDNPIEVSDTELDMDQGEDEFGF